MLGRRDMLKMPLLALVPLTGACASGTREGVKMEQRIADVIAQYSRQGDHRTGTLVDNQSAAWLGEQIREAGAEPIEERFPFRRVEIRDARLVVGDLDIEGVPLYDCAYTGPAGVSGRIGPVGSDTEIGMIAALPYAGTPEGQALERARREGKHGAIVVVADPRLPPGGATAFNAEDYAAPFGPPVLQVANDAGQTIRDAADRGAEARVIAHCDKVDSSAANMGAKVSGRRADLPPLVVMTPRSGWWSCASERGGGIATWIEMLRACVLEGSERDIWFTANTGHELGHVGLDHFLEQNRALVSGAAMWIHLGANYAAAIGGQVRLQYSDEEARQLVGGIAREIGVAAGIETPIGDRPFGEARNIHDGDGRYISILGGNGLFHHPADRWPDAVDVAQAVAWTRVMTRLVLALAAAQASAS